jgi:hypothetical protein
VEAPRGTVPAESEETEGRPSRGRSPRWLLRGGAAVEGPGGGEYRWLLRGGALEDPPWGNPGASPPRRERTGRHPETPPTTGAPRSPGRGSAPVRWCPLCPERDPRGGLRGASPGGLSMGALAGDLRGGAQGKTTGGRPPCQLLRGGAGPGAIRRGNPCRSPPRRGPVGSHPGSDARGRSSEEPRRGDAPAGRGQGQGGRDLVGGGSEEPAPAGKLEGTHRGSLRGGRNGGGSRGQLPGSASEEMLRGRPLLAPTKAGRTRLQGIEPDQESVHPASGG